MMSKKQSSKKQLGMYFLIIPIVVASLFVFGISKAYQASEPIEILFEEQLQQNEDIINRDTIPTKKEDMEVQPQRLIRKVSSGTRLENPLVILDGVQQEKSFNDVVLGVSSEEIESIEVLKDESATAAYGKKGEKGVIIITTKEKAKQGNGGKRFVLKGDSVGRKVEVESKNENGRDSGDGRKIIEGGEVPISTPKTEEGGNEIRIRMDSKVRINGKGPKIIIDGKEVDEESMQKINPDLIESISVLKGEEAIKKYKEKGENGVVLIELKKDAPL